MAKAIIEGKCPTKADEWRERIAEQARSGLSISSSANSAEPHRGPSMTGGNGCGSAGEVRFALVEGEPAKRERATEAQLELILPGGARMHIRSGVDGATLRTVLEALRG
jgi:hypothetical protein